MLFRKQKKFHNEETGNIKTLKDFENYSTGRNDDFFIRIIGLFRRFFR